MITINAWLSDNNIYSKRSSRSPVNGSLFKPLWAVIIGKHVGHVNIIYEFYGTPEEIAKIRAQYPHLKFTDTNSFKSIQRASQYDPVKCRQLKTATIRSQRGEIIQGISCTMSFNPG